MDASQVQERAKYPEEEVMYNLPFFLIIKRYSNAFFLNFFPSILQDLLIRFFHELYTRLIYL